MEVQQMNEEAYETFTWTIKDFSKMNSNKIYSESFFIGGHPWRILLFPRGNGANYLSIYLDAGDAANLPYGWSRFAKFKLVLINQVDGKMTRTKESEHRFNARDNDWGFTSFMPLDEFGDPKRGFILYDTCIIEAKISLDKSELENQVDEVSSPISSQVSAEVSIKPSEVNNPSPIEIPSDSIGELMDFRGLGKIEKAFVPLLKEVCSQHPSVIECQQKRSRRFTEWAFTALGRVLHFLKTKKVKDMNDDACKHLQILWEELETFRFDLTWLEPHVQSALGMKHYMERAEHLKDLKKMVDDLEIQMKKLKAKMAATEVDLESARIDLAKAEEGFEVRDLDAELGYGP